MLDKTIRFLKMVTDCLSAASEMIRQLNYYRSQDKTLSNQQSKTLTDNNDNVIEEV